MDDAKRGARAEVILFPPSPPIERERTYHWVDRASDLDMTEVERLTWRVGEDGKTVRERRLIRTKMDGVKIATPDTVEPEILQPGERSKDELTARIDRIAALKGREKSLSEAPPLPSAIVQFGIFAGVHLQNPDRTFVNFLYWEPSEWKFKGNLAYDNEGRLLSFTLQGTRIPLPGGDKDADLTVTERPIPTTHDGPSQSRKGLLPNSTRPVAALCPPDAGTEPAATGFLFFQINSGGYTSKREC